MSTSSFLKAYDRVLGSWPVEVEPIEVATGFGVTRVNACGPPGAPPLVLLPGGGATSTVWRANVADLSRDHRVYAVDLMGDAGRSVPAGTAIRTPTQLMTWLDDVLDGLGTGACDLAGHSYGGWMALTYALFTHARARRAVAAEPEDDELTYDPRAIRPRATVPEGSEQAARVRRLALLDPTSCFAGFRTGYLLHALPLLRRPSPARMRRLIHWETRGAVPDAATADWLDVVALGSELPKSPVVAGGRPTPEALAGLDLPVLVVLAGRSRAHDAGKVGRVAAQVLPEVEVVTVPGVSHHGLPMLESAALDAHLRRFLG